MTFFVLKKECQLSWEFWNSDYGIKAGNNTEMGTQSLKTLELGFQTMSQESLPCSVVFQEATSISEKEGYKNAV